MGTDARASVERIGREEFAAMLERNGYHTASADIAAGVDYAEATAYLLSDFANPPHYQDGEEFWLRGFVRSLHEGEAMTTNRDRIADAVAAVEAVRDDPIVGPTAYNLLSAARTSLVSSLAFVLDASDQDVSLAEFVRLCEGVPR